MYGERNPVSHDASVYEISQARLQNLNVRNARESMEYVPGIYFSKTFRNESTFRLRGFEQRQISVFLNGIPVSAPYNGVIDVSQLTGADLHSVRVSRGSSSMLYGGNSLGGSVNLITAPPEQGMSGSVRLERSDHGRTFGTVNLSGGTDRFRVSASGSYDDADAFRLPSAYDPTLNEDGEERENSAYTKKHAGLKFHYLINSSHKVGIHYNLTRNRYNVPPNAVSSWARYWQFPLWQKQMMSLNSEHVFASGVRLRTVIYEDRYKNKLRSFDDDTYSSQNRGYAFDSVYDDYTRGINLYPKFRILSAGYTEGALTYKKDVHREGPSFGDYGVYSTGMWIAGIEQDFNISNRLNMVIGINGNYLVPTQAEDLQLRDPLTQMNGRMGVEYQVNKGVSGYVTISRKSRFPTLKELYSSRLGRNIPNPELESETSLQAEVGGKYIRNRIQLSASVYKSAVSDLIGNVVVGEGKSQLQNINSASLAGGEIGIQYRTASHSVYLNYAYLDAVNTSDDRPSQHLEYRPVHRMNGLFHIRLFQSIDLDAEASYTADQYFQNSDTGDWERLNDIFLVNLKADYRIFEKTRLYIGFDNLLDRAYFSEYGVPMPGREMTLGMKYGF
ncbi:MAG: Colicin I receptor [Candidatus Marinimicrobia bacterium]|nr:Colicin I receptor [Candidatus Neomarinimicrobiota bacterium]